MTNGYEEVYADVASQREGISGTRRQILERRQQWAKPVVSGSAKQRRIAMRRVVRTPEHHAYVIAKKEDIASMSRAETELTEYESNIASYESKIKEYQTEGYTLSKGEEGELQFSKQTYVPGKRVRVGTRPTSVYVTWKHRVTGKTGRFQGRQANIADYTRQLDVTNRDIVKVTTVGGGPIYKTTAGHWTSEDKVLYEAKPIETVYKATPELKYLLKHSDLKEQETLREAIIKGPVVATKDFIGPVYQPIYPAMQDAYKSLHPVEKYVYGKQFKVETIVTPTSQEEKTLLKASELVTQKFGSERLDIYAAKHIQDWGIPAVISGWQIALGIDKKAWKNLHEQYASEILGASQKKGESVLDYTGRFFTSPQAITNIYLPVATMGIGYVAKPLTLGVKAIPVSAKVSMLGSKIASMSPTASKIIIKVAPVIKLSYKGIMAGGKRFAYHGSKHSRLITAASISTIGGITAYQIATSPDSSSLIIGRTVASFGKMIGGYHAGGKLYGATHTKLIQESYWTGTEYEQTISESYRMRSVLGSQYKPYEFGSPSTHYTAEFRPSWQKFPYVPKHPVQQHTMTLGIRDPSGSSQAFFIKRNIMSSRDFATFESSPLTIKVKDVVSSGKGFKVYKTKDYTFNIFSGETTVKGSTTRVIGFGSGRYMGDVVPDVMATRMYSYSVSSADYPAFIKSTYLFDPLPQGLGYITSKTPHVGWSSRPVIMHGTQLSKTYYGGTPKWVGKHIKFMTAGKESESTLGFARVTTRGRDVFDVSHVVKPSIKTKDYFGDPGSFDYQLPPKIIDDVVMPGGMQREVGFKIDSKGPLSISKTKHISYVDYGMDATQISSYWKGVSPLRKTIPLMDSTQSMQSISTVSSMQKIGVIPLVKTMQINLNIDRDIQSQISMPMSMTKTASASMTAQESMSASLTKQLQMQQQRQRTYLKQITVTMPTTMMPMIPFHPQPHIPYTTVTPPPVTSIIQPPYKPPPPIYFDLPEGEPVKKRKKKVMDDLSKGYRFRSWKVPTMKDILGINNM